jgi:hypothetical protein
MDDYYILFRDSRNPVPIVRKEKHWQEDWLAEDDASYVWGYVGKLSGSQAESAQKRIDLRFKALFDDEYVSVPSNDRFEFATRRQEALDLLQYISPHLAKLAEASSDHRFRYIPEDAYIQQQIADEVSAIQAKNGTNDGITIDEVNLAIDTIQSSLGSNLLKNMIQYPSMEAERKKRSELRSGGAFPGVSPKKERPEFTSDGRTFVRWVYETHGYFIQLVSLKTLLDCWSRAGFCHDMNLLRRTAAIWIIETLSGKFVFVPENEYHPVSPEVIQKVFQLIVHDKEYILNTPKQWGVLFECVDIVKKIRKMDACDDNFENVYLTLLEQKRESERAKRKARKAKKDGIIVDDYSVAPPLTQAASERELPKTEVSAHQEQTDVPNGTPPIFIAPSGKSAVSAGKRKTGQSAMEAYNQSKPLEEPPDEVLIVNKEPLAVRDDTVAELIKEQTELLRKIYLSDAATFLTQEDYPDETKGFWEPQKLYASRMKISENTLKRYREKSNGVKWSQDSAWGKDKVGHVFKKENDRPNSPFLYFVYDD